MADEAGGWVLDPKNPNRATYTDEDGFEHEQFATGYSPTSAQTPTASAAPTTATPTASAPTEERGGWRRLKDSFDEAGQHGFPGLVARKWYDWTDYGVQDLIKKGYSPEDAEKIADQTISLAQKGIREDAAKKQAADPNWKPDETFWEAASHIDKWGPWLAGQVLGSAGPESLVNPGGTAAARIGSQVAMGGASDAAYQAQDLVDKVSDEFSTAQMLTSAAMGGLLQSAFEVPSFIRNLYKERGVDTTPSDNPIRGIDDSEPLEAKVDYTDTLNPNEYSLDELAKIEATGDWRMGEDGLYHRAPEEPELPLEQPQAAPEARTKDDLAREAGLVPEEVTPSQVAPEGNLEATPKVPEPLDPDEVTPQMIKAKDRLDTITKDWKNAPEFEVFKDFDDIEGVHPNWNGFIGDDGIVRINSKVAKDPAMVDAVVFHEALGHHGLTQKFGDGLDKLMHDLYDTNPDIRAKADAYGKKFPDTYADADSPTARHVEEVLAEMSEKGRISPTVRGRIVRYLNELGRKMGLNIKYGDKEIRTILGMAHDATINGKSVADNGFSTRPSQGDAITDAEAATIELLGLDANRIDKLRQDPQFRNQVTITAHEMRGDQRSPARTVQSEARPMQRTSRDDDEMTLSGSINPSRIESKQDFEDILEGLANEYTPGTISQDATKAEAKAMGINIKNAAKDGDIGNITSRVYAARQAMTAQLNKVAKLQDKLEADGYSEAIQADFIKALTTLRGIHATVSNNASELGRALSSLRMMSDGKMNASKIVKAMQEQGNELLGDPEQFKKFMATLAATADIQGTLPAIKMAKQSFQKGAEKYIFSAWYNMLLSSPATHFANFVGTGGNFLADMTFMSGAAVKGQFGRNADRIRGREIAYRVWGALSAFKAGNETWSNTRRVLNGIDSSGAKTEGGQHVLGGNKALDFASGVLESPSRALAGADEFWRNILHLSNVHGLAVRNAGNEGLKGQAFKDRVQDLISNPTKEMLDASADYAKVLQFQDKASAIGSAIMSLQTPKTGLTTEQMKILKTQRDNTLTKLDKATDPVAKAKLEKRLEWLGNRIENGEESSVPGRIARGILKTAVPFVRTPDALIRTALRYTPLGAFERENIKGWKAGGAQRDVVKARMIMGSALSFWLATQAYKGNITGQGPSDSKKKQEWLASHQENSIKVGDKYYSIAGLEPVSTVINGIATLTERSKNGEIGEGDAAKQALSLAQGIGAVLTENSYMEGLNSLLEINDKDTNKAEAAFTNFIAGLASSATTPAILRKYTQAGDPAVRDTTGDGSMYDRVTGRIKSALPGLSDTLPQRYDVYGRAQKRVVAGPDLASRTNVRLEETDPVVRELTRLADSTDKVIVGAPGKSNIKVDGVQRRLTAEEFQKYQHLSGYLIVEATREEMKTPDWQTGDDAYRIDALKDITKDMRQAARDYLFDPDDETEGDLGDE